MNTAIKALTDDQIHNLQHANSVRIIQTLKCCFIIKTIKNGQESILLHVNGDVLRFTTLGAAQQFLAQYRTQWTVDELDGADSEDDHSMSITSTISLVEDAKPKKRFRP